MRIIESGKKGDIMSLREYMKKYFNEEEIEKIYERAERKRELMLFNEEMNRVFIQMAKEKTNLPYEEISKKVHMSEKVLRNMEEGKTAFSFRKIRKMAELLGFSFDFNLTAR